MGRKLISQIKKAAKPIKNTPEDVAIAEAQKKKAPKKKGEEKQTYRIQFGKAMPVVSAQVTEVKDPDLFTQRRVMVKPPTGYIKLDVVGSNGKIYTVVVPQSYRRSIPRKWRWNQRRYKAAEMISAGYPVLHVAKEIGVNKSIIYAWLQHPEFKGHVDGLTLETGWANKQERIAGLNRVTSRLFDKVMAELDGVRLTDKSIGPVLVAIQSIAKQIAQEKDEFVEQSKVESNTTVNGTLGVAVANIDLLMSSKAAEERKILEAEFKDIGDEVIRSITGEKE